MQTLTYNFYKKITNIKNIDFPLIFKKNIQNLPMKINPFFGLVSTVLKLRGS